MHRHTRAALLLALAPTLACRMLYITGEQGEGSTSGTSGGPPITPSTMTLAESSSEPTPSTAGLETGVASSMTGTNTSTTEPEITVTGSSGPPDSTIADPSASESDATTTAPDGPICGDGHQDPGEECDGTSDCDPDCNFFCGNGTIEFTLGEECDDGEYNQEHIESVNWPFCTKECKRNGRYVFVTSKGDFTGKLADHDDNNLLTGVEAADAHCTAVAKDLPEISADTKFVAWISAWKDNKDLTWPAARIGECTNPFYLPKPKGASNRILVAKNYSDLTTNDPANIWEYLINPINRDEHANAVQPSLALTATSFDGKPYGLSNCFHWTSADPEKLVGAGTSNSTKAAWTADNQLHSCSESIYHLYCFEQCPP